MFTVAIIGRTNVGKTTLFNKLCKKQLSVVHKSNGVTRDRQHAVVLHKGFPIQFIDTAGLEDANFAKQPNPLAQKSIWQMQTALDIARFCLIVVDGRSGVLPEDKAMYELVRKKGLPFALIVNKAENPDCIELNDIYKLHRGDIIYTSAAHGANIHEVLKVVYSNIPPEEVEMYKDLSDIEVSSELPPNHTGDLDGSNFDDKYIPLATSHADGKAKKEKSFRLAVIGRPNAGKSTLINNLLKEERVITDSTAGTTRDAIEIHLRYDDYDITLIDTAGVRKKMSITEELEKLSVQASMNAIDFAHIVLLVIDVTQPMEFQDKTLLDKIISEGRPAIICYNKWDTVTDAQKKAKLLQLRDLSNQQKHWGRGFFTLSALQDGDISGLLGDAIRRYESWSTRISTKKLNNWLHDHFLQMKEPPMVGKRPLKLKFISQKSTKPPTFIVSANSEEVPPNYEEFLKNKLAEHFSLLDIPIRVKFKKAANPYGHKR